jgi:hypothetical protein
MTTHISFDSRPQAGRNLRTYGRAIRLVFALSISTLNLVPAAFAQSADAPEKVSNGYAIHQSIELGGHVADHFGSSAMWDTLVNLDTGPRVLTHVFNMHSVDTTKTPYYDDLTTNSFGYGGDPYATTVLRVSKGRAYKLDGDFRRSRQYFDYDLFGNPLIPDNAVPQTSVLDTPHLYNTVRKTGEVNLTVLPLSRVSVRSGYWRTGVEGPSFSSNVNKSLTNPLLDQWWRYSNETYTGGVDFKLFPKTILSYDQYITHFKQDTTWRLTQFEDQLADGTPVTQGLNVFTTAANTCLVAGTTNTIKPSCNGTLNYHRFEPIRTLFPTEQFRFVSASIPRVQMNGRVSYSGGSSEANHYNEAYAGWSDKSINTTGRNVILLSGIGPNSHLGSLRRINVSADYGVTVKIGPKVELSDVVDFRSFRDPGLTQPVQQTQFGTSLANTSNFFTPALCPPPYTASTCPLHTKSTAADISQTYRQSYFGQTSTTNTALAFWSPLEKLRLSIGYRYRDRSIIKTLQNTTTSTFTPPFANRGACATVALNADGTCTVTPASTPAIEKNEIHEHWALFGMAAQPTSQWSVKLNVDAMYADEAYTQISPRQLQHVVLRTFYKPQPWVSVSGAINLLESRDNVEFVHHTAHSRDFSFGTSFEPSDKWALDLNYSYDNDFSRTDVCYFASAPLPGAGTCAIPGSVANIEPFMGTGYYNDPTHFGTISLMLAPMRKVRTNFGYQINVSDGHAEILNARQVPGSVQSEYQTPFADVALSLAPQWTWKAAWNYYGYGEGSAIGPTLPRSFHGDVFTLGVRYAF